MLEYIAYAVAAFLLYQWLKAKYKTKPTQPLTPKGYVAPSRTVSAQLKIDYTDASNRNTQRTVNVISYQNGNPAGMSCYCNLRNEYRTFRLDRVNTATDTSTGEIISHLPAWLEQQHQQHHTTLASALHTQHPHLVPILLYIARADGAMRAPELQIITDLIASRIQWQSPTLEAAKRLLGNFETPSAATFEKHAKELAQTAPDELAQLIKAAQGIVQTQKTVHPNEQLAINTLLALKSQAAKTPP